nr:hypothetical protein [uncultured bacterium]
MEKYTKGTVCSSSFFIEKLKFVKKYTINYRAQELKLQIGLGALTKRAA